MRLPSLFINIGLSVIYKSLVCTYKYLRTVKCRIVVKYPHTLISIINVDLIIVCGIFNYFKINKKEVYSKYDKKISTQLHLLQFLSKFIEYIIFISWFIHQDIREPNRCVD